ncbi:hypothetical protein GYMLUDRAFT_41138 [Collybiopsis luxurians FD-317 M1]|uniref:Unplaced genomic scaffold GYMLUscaffold_16, whole genome shotgun sequence n=1 Tax=Collybiopsis luxurians FD-317 M1 TaxID=944289 RepID=A0A0D0CV19_9AGAR|nr:hypothetical protein GYMLUDRAFT_41138 [Collybiopsis luxurians FD-317 M1]
MPEVFPPGSAHGHAEFKHDGTIITTFTRRDGHIIHNTGKIELPEDTTVIASTCGAVLHHKAPGRGGHYNWRSKRSGKVVKLTVEANDGNIIEVDAPSHIFVKTSDRKKHVHADGESKNGGYHLH